MASTNFGVLPILLHKHTQSIDVAAIGQPLSSVSVDEQLYKVDLDIIGAISTDEFKSLFYHSNGETFGVNPNAVLDLKSKSLISFTGEDRTINSGDASFNLLETIFEKLEDDLGVKRECFDICSKLELTKELSSIKTLADIESCVVLCSLKWSDILNLLKTKSNQLGVNLTGSYIGKNGDVIDGIVHILHISVIFKNPSTQTKDVMVTFRYAVIFKENEM